jgi:hypothetical protein
MVLGHDEGKPEVLAATDADLNCIALKSANARLIFVAPEFETHRPRLVDGRLLLVGLSLAAELPPRSQDLRRYLPGRVEPVRRKVEARFPLLVGDAVQRGAGSDIMLQAFLDAEVHAGYKLVKQLTQQLALPLGQRRRDKSCGANRLHFPNLRLFSQSPFKPLLGREVTESIREKYTI